MGIRSIGAKLLRSSPRGLLISNAGEAMTSGRSGLVLFVFCRLLCRLRESLSLFKLSLSAKAVSQLEKARLSTSALQTPKNKLGRKEEKKFLRGRNFWKNFTEKKICQLTKTSIYFHLFFIKSFKKILFKKKAKKG